MTVIGRSDPYRGVNPDIDLGPIDIKNTVSRIHAEIYADTAGWVIVDKGSMNGTKINGKRLRPNEPERLLPDDLCGFGEVKLYFADGKLKQAKE